MATKENKKPKCWMLVLLSWGGLSVIVTPAFAQTWIQSSAPITNWSAVASSADGRKLAAAAFGGGVYVSTDSGSTWGQTGASVTNWQALAASADGHRLVGAVNRGCIYTSPDAGSTWSIANTWSTNWYAAASSGDGTTLIVAAGGPAVPFGGQFIGPVFLSHDSGTSWTNTDLPSLSWSSVACSTDGTKLMAAPFSGNGGRELFFSIDAGAHWVSAPAPGAYLSSAALSRDGTVLLAVDWDFVHGCFFRPCFGASLYRSTDYGTTWAPVGGLGPAPIFLAASVDGSRWVAAGPQNGPIAISADSAETWIPTSSLSTNWSAVAASADGNVLVAVINGGGIYTWQGIPAPVLTLSRSVTNLFLSWTVPSIDFVLQENADVTTTNWTDIPGTPALDWASLRYEVNVPVTNRSSFYRLKH
jgi:hypothetical protein